LHATLKYTEILTESEIEESIFIQQVDFVCSIFKQITRWG